MAERVQEQIVSTLNVTSETSVGNSSSLWSVSTISNTGQEEDSCIIIENDNSDAHESKCWPILKLLQSIFRWRKFGAQVHVDKHKILTDLAEYMELMGNFLKLNLTSKIESYSEQCHLSKVYGNFCLPAAQIWAAAYLLNLYMSPYREKESDKTPFVNSNNFRRVLVTLCWEMEASKKSAHKFYTRFQKFTKDLNNEFQKLCRTALLSTTGSKAKLEFPVKNTLKLNLKKDKIPIVLDVKSSSSENFLFSLSIDTEKSDGIGGGVKMKNQDFSKLKCEVQEEIITNLLSASVASLETCHDILECSRRRISSRGIIKKDVLDENKDVTCYTALRSITNLTTELTSVKLEEEEMSHLFKSISNLFDKWNDYVGYAQGIILNFYELSDMITICYCFTLHHIKIKIPTLMEIQKEVDVKSKFQKKCEKSNSKQLNLKQYAVESLLQESNERPNSSIATTGSSALKMSLLKENNYNYEKVMLSTKYPLVIQEHPLQLLNKIGGNYSIIVRPCPDFERIDSNMIIQDRSTLIESPKKASLSNNTKCSESFQLDTFKKLETQLLNEIA